jgi:hypothetical protein
MMAYYDRHTSLLMPPLGKMLCEIQRYTFSSIVPLKGFYPVPGYDNQYASETVLVYE